MSVRDPGAREPFGHEDEIRRLLGIAGSPPALPEDEVAPIREATRAVWRRKIGDRHARRTRSWIAAAAACAALVAVCVAWWWNQREAPGSGVADIELWNGEVDLRAASTPGPAASKVSMGASLLTGPDGRIAIRMPSGASVRIDARTKLRLASPRRLELASGAVYVDSTVPRGALEVVTPFARVVEVGTQFEVRLPESAAGQAKVLVRVREGKVLVAAGRHEHEVRSGRELAIAGDGSAEERSLAAHDETWRWAHETAPPIEIEGVQLSRFLDWVARETGMPWRWAEASAAAFPGSAVLHGSIDGLTPEEALQVVLTGVGLDHRRAAGEILVLRQARPGT